MSNRPQITVKTGKVAGNPAILIIPDGDINATQIMGFPELIEQLEDLGVVLADSGLIENANTVRSLLGLLQISKLAANVQELADSLASDNQVESALLLDTALAVLKNEMGSK